MISAALAGDAPRLRIVVESPPAGVAFAVQRGRDGLLPPTRTTRTRLTFEFTLRLGKPRAGGRPNFLGDCAQGTPDARFVYVNSGQRARQPGSPWDRRAKIMLGSIDKALLQRALDAPDCVLEARFAGAGRDGGPACATVPLLDGGWQLAAAHR